MSNKTRNIIAFLLLIAFLLWLLSRFLPSPAEREIIEDVPAPAESVYEPQFSDEGDLWIVNAEGDTLQAIDIELAETEEEITYGMMYRRNMDERTGMLFLRDREQQQSFWMRNTYVSLDIIYINSQWEIVSIVKRAEPLNETSLPSEGPAQYILEVKGGFSDKHGLQKGDRIFWERG